MATGVLAAIGTAWRARRAGFASSRSGAAGTESVIVIAVFLAIVFFLVDLALALFVASSLQFAANVAHNRFAVTRDVAATMEAARDSMPGFAEFCIQAPQILYYDSVAGAEFGGAGSGYESAVVPPAAVAARLVIPCSWSFLMPGMRSVASGVELKAWSVVVFE